MTTSVFSKYKALESLMEETYTNTVTIKEQKISALESRLVFRETRSTRSQQTLHRSEHAAHLKRLSLFNYSMQSVQENVQ